jgi:hypothetical protein
MTTLHALRHVSSAIRHAEALSDEAEDLRAPEIAARLRERARSVSSDLDVAVASIEEIEPSRQVRERCHGVLTSVYAEATLQLERTLPPEEASRLSPGGHLDVSERVRFRLRHIPDDAKDDVLDVKALLERALFAYDAAVDGYLSACADAQSKKDRVVVKSQALRMELERAKHQLLVRAEPASEAWRRIKGRTVRTKRARWLDEARAQRLLALATSP